MMAALGQNESFETPEQAPGHDLSLGDNDRDLFDQFLSEAEGYTETYDGICRN